MGPGKDKRSQPDGTPVPPNGTVRKLLITGGCGFIGSNLAVSMLDDGCHVTCLDNLSRRGTEVLRDRVVAHGARFVQGDIRTWEDLERLDGPYDVMIECSAEPSVLVGTRGTDARFVIDNNLLGSVNCFEFARRLELPVLFLSTSRVYPYTAINRCRFIEGPTRFRYDDRRPGISAAGISVDFPLAGRRSLYGATKLASELLLQEYSEQFGLPSLIDRCGVVAGPWQLGKVDQGVFTFWVAAHYFGRPLKYIGFGGEGKQVRDLLHVDDLVELVRKQLAQIEQCRGEIFNVGGSTTSNLSLLETTTLARDIVGKEVPIGSEAKTRPADVLWYITDNGETPSRFDWRPARSPGETLSDIYAWLRDHEEAFKRVFGRE